MFGKPTITLFSLLLINKMWTHIQAHTHAHTECIKLPLVCRRKARWECGAAPGAIWQRHRHLHNVIFYLISHSKCNQKLMRALSCLADWQHDIALTPNTGKPHPNDAILKPSLCSCTNTSVCVCVEGRERVGVCVCSLLSYCESQREGNNFII